MKYFFEFSIGYQRARLNMARVSSIRPTRGAGILIGSSGVIKKEVVEARGGGHADEILAGIGSRQNFSANGALVGLILAKRGEPILIHSAP